MMNSCRSAEQISVNLPEKIFALKRVKIKGRVFVWIWLSIAALMLIMNFLPNDLIDPFETPTTPSTAYHIKAKKEVKITAFDDKVALKFKSVDNIALYVRMYAKDYQDKALLLEDLSKLIRKRFYHAYAIYGLQENWIAVLAGKFIWRDLSAKVIPDDILNGNVAACSQVSIILMETCRQLGIPTRKVGLVGHYALEAFVNGNWHFIDADIKPDFDAINGRKSVAEIVAKKEQYALYANTILDSTEIAKKFSRIDYGKVNASPAPRAYIFHVTTKFLSHWAWLIPFFIAFRVWRKQQAKGA